MTGYEEQLVEEERFRENTSALCNAVLAHCLCEPGQACTNELERVEQLTVAERDAAVIRLRRLTFGDRIESRVQCETCGEPSELTFDLGQLPVDIPDFADSLEVDLPGGQAARLRLPTAGDQARLLEARLTTSADRRTWLLARCLEALGDWSGPLPFEAVHALSCGTRRLLESTLDSELPDLDLSMEISCPSCGHKFDVPFDVSGFFFLN